MIDELKQYFDTHSKEEIWDSWNMTKECDKVGPTMDEFLTNTNKIKQMEQKEIKTIPSIIISDEGYCDHILIITYSGYTDKYNVIYEDAYEMDHTVKHYTKSELLTTFTYLTEEHLKQIKIR